MMRKDVMRAVEILNRLENTASVVYSGASIAAPPVSTLLLLPPTVTMTVDQLSASIGDTLTYTVVISNISLVAITDLPFTDALPQGSLYLSDSFTINGSPAATHCHRQFAHLHHPSDPGNGNRHAHLSGADSGRRRIVARRPENFL